MEIPDNIPLSVRQTTVAVTVVVVNWNRRDLLRACLRSLCHQKTQNESKRLHLEIFVIDNGSSDDSARMVETDFPEVRLIRNSRNEGFCRANNQGIAQARGEFVALLNNDAEADPAWVSALVDVLERHPEAGMAASKIVEFAEPGRIDKAGHLIYPDGQNGGRGAGEWDRGQFDREEEVLWPDGCAAMYRKTMLDQIGGFDEDLFAYADDAELGLRARIAGWRCRYTPLAVVRHHRGATLGRANPDRVRLIERNRILLAAKLFPWSLLVLNPVYFAARIGAGLLLSRNGRGDIEGFAGFAGKLRLAGGLLRGQCEALWMLPRTLAKRGAVNRLARISMAERRRLILNNRLGWRALVGAAREARA